MTLTHSESLVSLAPALAQVQAEVEHAAKNAANAFLQDRGARGVHKYADITEVIDTIREVMGKHGFSYSQHPGFRDGNEGALITLETLLLHSSGEWIKSEAATPLERVTAQGVGSAITYLRRYALTSIIGLGQEDDDAQEASRPRDTERRAAPQPPPLREHGTPIESPIPTAREMRDLLNVAAEQAGVSREDILAYNNDPFAWLREHSYSYISLVAAARSRRDGADKVEQAPLVTT